MNWNGNEQAGGNCGHQPWPTYNPNTIPNPVQNYPAPLPGYLSPGAFAFGVDPNPNFTAAINRLAAALEKFNER